MASSDKECVTFLSSSHGKKNHHFPQMFLPLFKNSKRFEEKPDIRAIGGRIMDCDAICEVINLATEVAPQKHTIILNLGDNNIRKHGHLPEVILCDYVEIVEQTRKIKNCRLVFTSLVPTFGRDEEYRNEFWRMSEHLKALARLNSHVSWCNFTKCLYKNGRLDPRNFQDDVHLSRSGAKIVAASLFTHLSNSPKIK